MTTDDPRSYSADELSTAPAVRANLAAVCEDSAEWRIQKAAQYPDDARNKTSAVALSVAAREIAELPDDDPRLETIARFWRMCRHNQDAISNYMAEQNKAVGRHCFGTGATLTTHELLMKLVHEALHWQDASFGES